jgi:hypothetical protein
MSAAQVALEVIFMFRFVFAVDAVELSLFTTLNTNVTQQIFSVSITTSTLLTLMHAKFIPGCYWSQ